MTPHTESPIAAAKQRHRLADVAGRTGIYLPATTGTLTVRCPMPAHGHPDRTPSMRLYLDNDRYYCFGCGSKGDVIQWIQDTEGLDIAGALRTLDDGRQIANAWPGSAFDGYERTSPAPKVVGGDGPDLARSRPDRLQAAMAEAWNYYTAPPRHDAGVAYLARRGIDVSVVETHNEGAEVGHTPASPGGLTAALHQRGFTDDALIDAGLSRRSAITGDLVDFFRQRVLVPIRAGSGEVRGLVGRSVGAPRQAKYTNSPQTAIYDKSVQLYRPLPLPGPVGAVVAVEGPLDALAIAAAAIHAGRAHSICPVTQSGRELSDLQVRTIARRHPGPIVLGFDADTAGRDSTARYARAFASVGRRVLVAQLPDGQDPASWLQHAGPTGLNAWQADRLRAAAGSRGITALSQPPVAASGMDL